MYAWCLFLYIMDAPMLYHTNAYQGNIFAVYFISFSTLPSPFFVVFSFLFLEASVDAETDRLIRQVISEVFREATVIMVRKEFLVIVSVVNSYTEKKKRKKCGKRKRARTFFNNNNGILI